jgi:hypothetical protein
MVGPAMGGPPGPAAGAGAFILPWARLTTVSNLAFVSYKLSGKQETPMSAPILKKHGAHATGTISEEGDGQWRASLLVRDLARKIQQTRGPKFFHSEPTARAWITQQAALHGFTGGDFDINLELAG